MSPAVWSVWAHRPIPISHAPTEHHFGSCWTEGYSWSRTYNPNGYNSGFIQSHSFEHSEMLSGIRWETG